MTLKELEEFCNGLGFDGKIGQCCGIENALYCDLGNDYDGPTVIYAPPGNEYVYIAEDLIMKLSKDKHYKYEYVTNDGDCGYEDDMTIIYRQYKLKDTEAVQKAIYALKQEWKECLTKIRIRKAKSDFR
jgi:hypothetical protein